MKRSAHSRTGSTKAVARPLPAHANGQQTLRAAIVAVLAAAAVSQVPTRKALAGPTPCQTNGTTVTCENDQSTGVREPEFNGDTMTSLTLSNLTTNVNPAGGNSAVRIDEARGEEVSIQNFAIQISGSAAQPLDITSSGAFAIDARTIGGIGDGGASATFGFFCAGSDSAEVGGNGTPGNLLSLSLTNINLTADGAGGVRLVNAAGQGGEGGGGNACHGSEAGGIGGSGAIARFNASNTTIRTFGDLANGLTLMSSGGRGNACHGSEAGGIGGSGAIARFNASNTTIRTFGDLANGLTLMSSGGRGGQGGAGGAFRYGSRGGVGGTGGAVEILGSATLETDGFNSLGIFAISFGGDGGNGGSSSAFGGGGNGPLGAGGGLVRVDGSFDITTDGDSSHGIGAYSLGGRGGQGGDGTFFNPSAGSGGGTANSGDVIVISRGDIQTFGDYSAGIVAQSVAGYAGDGGSSNSIVNFGAGGGSAGAGGRVDVDNFGDITTIGRQGHAIMAQSIGGGGGAGGGGFGAFFAGGGDGGAGGNGGIVDIYNEGALRATGVDARGIYAQSIGGAGGDGADQGGLVAVGGRGATTSDGDSVTVRNIGEIQSASHAIFAESIGGGGGNGGSSTGWFAMGGTGGAGGDGGVVDVTNSGDLTTRQNNSSAIFAHSIGGGGGNGGNSASTGVYASIAIGGKGKEGGDGQTVTVRSEGGTISTGANAATGGPAGDTSHGIFAQSVGGGGGNGGFAIATSFAVGSAVAIGIGGEGDGGGDGRAVAVTNASTISTNGNDAHAIYAESAGGGGGSGGFAITMVGSESASGSLAVGGKGGGGGSGDTVAVTSNGESLQTAGDRSYGILAQSIGGGGGNGGFAIAGALTLLGPAGALSFGGSGAGGGSANDVTVASSSDISTAGIDAHGLFAQSIGGGGGNGGFSVAGAISTSVSASASFGGTGAGGGNAGSVTVGAPDAFTTGTLHTRGDRSGGLVAQSVGGGGGSGGFSVAGTISATGSAGLSIGGSGGGGRDADTVTVRTVNTVITEGNDAHGIVAQSVGGGGGNGGFSVAGSITLSNSANASIGGRGDGGGAANTVNVTNLGESIQTSGTHSFGLLAQSVGGGGGDGGFSVAGSISQGAAANFSMGGNAGPGGIARDVFVTSTAAIATQGDESSALVAQSIGGGGGTGGFSITGGLSAGSGTVGVSLGGNGGQGASSGRVFVTTTGADTGVILTDGDRATGIFAQSVGGGGGSGGFSVGGSISNGPSANFSLGGSGLTGGNSDLVFVNSGTSVRTLGADSHGIFAQSLGGGGGSGGFSVAGSMSHNGALNASIGGGGGTGGDAQDVTVLSAGLGIETSGAHSYGIVAQSVGGGGGDGGFSVAGSITDGASASLSVGGSGQSGGLGRNVLLESSTAVRTNGEDSHAVFAQSVGGGGGSGGFSVAGSVSKRGVDASIGGNGGAGGHAGRVTLNNTASAIETSGLHAYGVIAQSLGGGGGDGGFSIAGGISDAQSARFSLGGQGDAGGDGEAVGLTSSSTVLTRGDDSHGVFAQSLGGGGGSGGFSVAGSIGTDGQAVNLSLGGSGDSGGSAGAVDLFNTGDAIVTLGARSYGLIAQSIGGGGGDGGFSIAGSISKGRAANLSMGGSGGAGGDSSDVTLNSTGDVMTQGADAHAIFAQSVGGGGGSGGFSVSGSLSSDDGSFGASIGGFGEGGGNAGRVMLGTTSAIDGLLMTEGDRAYGILAQSIGGGGGDGGFSVAAGISKGSGAKFSLGGSGDIGGDGDAVSVVSASIISTLGNDAHGLFAQSVGGGGGSGGFSVAGGVATEGAAVNASFGGSGAAGGDGAAVDVASRGSGITTEGDRAYGIIAQSIGGGGGDGGFSVAGSINKTRAVNFSLGGSGDVGGDAGNVTVLSNSNIGTAGVEAHAIFAQSLGGGGGSGGFSVAGSLFAKESPDAKIDFAIGGSGDGGGAAGAVNVGNEDDAITGTINTIGASAYGVFAQSIGGGGGNGGFSVAAGVSRSPTLNASIGGSAGAASDGGDVSVFTGADITTQGKASHGVAANSLGGGGGNGGFSIAGSATTDLTSVGLSIGGAGGGGGKGGAVDVVNSGTIATLGDDSYGVFAQSLGGGGGNGGFSVSGSLSAPPARQTSKGPRNLNVAFGGDGGMGDTGGAVTVTNEGAIDTFGKKSHGIVAHSLGGGGGDGGFALAGSLGIQTASTQGTRAVISVSVGGNGGSGDSGGDVSVTNTQHVFTSGEAARGVYAYSGGGGGGDGGMAFSIDTLLGKPHEGGGLNVEAAIGGVGGNGNDGGNVFVRNEGDIGTLGDRADAIYAQSIGGGGGDGGEAHSLSVDFTGGGKPPPKGTQKEKEWNFIVTVGGDGGIANQGGTVTVENAGAIETHGVNARGIVAQSVGGGGGSGGGGISGTGIEGVDTATELLDFKDKNLLDVRNWTIVLGGSGGANGDADAVTVTNSGSILTTGLASTAIFAQSIGGGGGEAQNFTKGTGSGGTADSGLTGRVALAGEGGASGNGGAVTITNSGEIVTLDHDAYGIFAQSIGGGGGHAGNVDRGLAEGLGPIPPLNIGVGLAFGGDGGNGGDGGVVTITNTNNILTAGHGATGIFAQSIGGGGGRTSGLGNEGFGTPLDPIFTLQNFAGSIGGAGSASEVTISQAGDIVVEGDDADGIFAQSTATTGLGRDVTISVSGNIDAGGAHSHGVRAQSLGQQGSGNVAITITGGSVRGGTGSGAAILFEDGASNTLENRGSIGRVDELDRDAVIGTAGTEAITNFGIIAGNVSLGAGANTFGNEAGAVFLSGLEANVGAAGLITNRGLWSVGDVDSVAATTLTGNIEQAATARLIVDLDHATRTMDQIALGAGTAMLAGAIEINQLNVDAIRPGDSTMALVSTTGALTTTDLQLDVAPSVVAQYQLERVGTGLVLNLATDFAAKNLPGGALSANARAVGEYLNDVQSAGSSAALAPTIQSIIAVDSVAELQSAYELLNPDGYAAAQVAAVQSGLQFADALLSCKERDGSWHFTREGECGWVSMLLTSQRRDTTAAANGYVRDAMTVSGGLQRQLDEHWHWGLAAAFDRDHIASNTFADGAVLSSAGSTVHTGGVLKGTFDATTFSASLTLGRGKYETDRGALLANAALSEQTVEQAGLQLRLGHAFDRESWYWRPIVDLGALRVRRDAFEETNAGASGLEVRASSDTVVSLRPAIEAGWDVPMSTGLARFHGRAGLTRFLSGEEFAVSASLIAAPDGVEPFVVEQNMDRTAGDLALGVDLFIGTGTIVRFGYAGQFADDSTAHGGGVKITQSF